MNTSEYYKHYAYIKKLKRVEPFYQYSDKYSLSEEDENLHDLMEIKFYKNHPFYVPFVGQDYFAQDKKQDKKILLVGESHYLHPDSTFYNQFKDDNSNHLSEPKLKDNWYEKDYGWDELDNCGIYREDIEWMWTESTVVYNLLKPGTGTYTLFSRILCPIYQTINGIDVDYSKKTINGDKLEDTIKKIVFMNYFLRPSEKSGKSIDPLPIDKKISFDTFIETWEALKQPCVLFTSKMAYEAFKESKNKSEKNCSDMECDFVVHPTSYWWFRKDKEGKNGFDKAKEILKEWGI